MIKILHLFLRLDLVDYHINFLQGFAKVRDQELSLQVIEVLQATERGVLYEGRGASMRYGKRH